MDHRLIPLCLGGDHAVTSPVVKPMSACHPRLSILHFDAHPDLYGHDEGNRRSHASPFASIMETGLVEARLTAITAAKVFKEIAAKMLEN
jgi:arginase family enzyme